MSSLISLASKSFQNRALVPGVWPGCSPVVLPQHYDQPHCRHQQCNYCAFDTTEKQNEIRLHDGFVYSGHHWEQIKASEILFLEYQNMDMDDMSWFPSYYLEFKSDLRFSLLHYLLICHFAHFVIFCNSWMCLCTFSSSLLQFSLLVSSRILTTAVWSCVILFTMIVVTENGIVATGLQQG